MSIDANSSTQRPCPLTGMHLWRSNGAADEPPPCIRHYLSKVGCSVVTSRASGRWQFLLYDSMTKTTRANWMNLWDLQNGFSWTYNIRPPQRSHTLCERLGGRPHNWIERITTLWQYRYEPAACSKQSGCRFFRVRSSPRDFLFLLKLSLLYCN